MLPGGFFCRSLVMPAHAAHPARGGRVPVSERYGVQNQPLGLLMTVPGAAHHEQDR